MSPAGPKPSRRRTVWIIVAICLGLLALCAVVSALTYVVIRYVNQAEAGPSCPDVPEDWSLTILDDFSVPDYSWPEASREDEYGTFRWEARDYIYSVEAAATDNNLDTIHRWGPILREFYLTVDLRQVRGGSNSYAGVVFHQTHYDHYSFIINGRQEFMVWLYHGHWIPLVEWTAEPAILQSGVNHLTVLDQGTHYAFCINGKLVQELDDDSRPLGYVGFVAGIEAPGDDASFEFDNLHVYAPEGDGAK